MLSVYAKEKPEYLTAAIDSVARQSLPPAEIVLVEDGPLPLELRQAVDRLKESYANLKTVLLKENKQLGRALAEGVRRCTYDLIARMDTDDIALPERFSLQCQYMNEHQEVAALGGYIEEFDDGNPKYRKVKTMPLGNKELARYARYRNPLNHMTVMFRKKAVLEAGNYRHFPLLEDYDLWTRLLSKGHVIENIPYVLARMRTNPGIYARRGGWDYYKRYMELRKRQRDYGLLTSTEYHIARLLTMGMTLQPSFMRRWVYRKALRR